MEYKTNDFMDEELRVRAASDEELNICLTNNYAFQKIFKEEENDCGRQVKYYRKKYI